ncbi:carbon-nitrogen hydrolase family protein [uncultured Citricoccus sp.]|uniref:carbon-nitrogen hydrolase family protein n=1 Tax=uncultured Citricoccus sp. TaxID=614031 RepID=UPI0026236235|nr:carbon-nitrogen hydrolase family protein [uncultured Citricoccus sp.]
MRIALAQILSTADPQQNLMQVQAKAAAAAAEGAQLVVFPEATMCRFGVRLDTIAEMTDGPWATAVKQIARAHNITIIAGMFTPAADGRVNNTLLATGPSGDATYDKIHLYDAFDYFESYKVNPGIEPTVVHINGVAVGLATCYDIRFPTLFQELALRGAELIVVSASWASGPGKQEQWEILAQARALDSATFIAACDQADPATVGMVSDGTPNGVGASLVVGPLGTTVASLDGAPGLLITDIDLDEVPVARNATGVLVNRRDFALAPY